MVVDARRGEMDLLKGAVAAAKKRKAPQSEDADGKRRWVRQSDLQRERLKSLSHSCGAPGSNGLACRRRSCSCCSA